MTNRTNQNYYQILGVPRNASLKDIKKVYRKIAQIYHPDVVKAQGLTNEEIDKKIERMKEINLAYDTLKRPEKRKEYDRVQQEGQRKRSAEGKPEGRSPPAQRSRRRTRTRSSSAHRGRSYSDFYNDIFGDFLRDGGMFGPEGSFLNFGYARKQEDHFLLSDSDMGLLAALREAYESKENGKWRVKKGEGDERDWMPEQVYSVKRDNGRVRVFRRIVDWRSKWNRDNKIKVRKEGSLFENEKEMRSDIFLGEYYLYGEGKERLGLECGIPREFGEFLGAMKRLAKKFADKEFGRDGKSDFSAEIRIIYNYNRSMPGNTKIEGKSLWDTDKNKELIRKVPLDEFWNRLREAEGRVVQVEGGVKSKEGQRSQSAEYKKPGPPEGMQSGFGENKG